MLSTVPIGNAASGGFGAAAKNVQTDQVCHAAKTIQQQQHRYHERSNDGEDYLFGHWASFAAAQAPLPPPHPFPHLAGNLSSCFDHLA